MKVLVNCANLRFGGGKTVAVNIIKQLLKFKDYDCTFIVPDDEEYMEFINNPNVHTILVDNRYNKVFLKPLLNAVFLKRIVLKASPDIVLSLGNIAIPTRVRQILLIQQAYFAYRDSIVWQRLPKKFSVYIKLMVLQIARNLKYADLVLVQTNAMLKRISKRYEIPLTQMELLPNAVNLTGMQSVQDFNPFFNADKGMKLLFLSKYYPHKNFEILIPLAKKIKEEKLKIKITITLGAEESTETAGFLKAVTNNGLEDIICNIGNVSFADIPKVYENHDGLFMPTLLESFSGTYIEAMYYRRPIFTSDIDFATEICKDAAYYFNPLNAAEILKTIKNGFSNPDLLLEKIAKGKTYCSQFKDWDELGEDLVRYLSELHIGPHLVRNSSTAKSK